MKTIRGFTLIEMMLVVAIVAIIASMAIPAFRDMVASNRQMTAANSLISTFNLARNEAITRSTSIDITAKVDADGNPTWQAGWTISMTDGAGVTTKLSDYETLPAELILTGEPDTPATPVEDPASAPPISFRYNSQGRLALADIDGDGTQETMNGPQTITLCDKRTGEVGRMVQVTPIGSVRVAPTPVTCN